MTDMKRRTAETMTEGAAQTPRQALLDEIGRKLVQARESRDESLTRVVRRLKLRRVHLEALESGNWEPLPDDVYALGFLRQYSDYLSLDLSEDIQRLKNDQYALTRPLTFPDPPVAPSRRWAWIAVIAFILLFIVFNVAGPNLSSPPESGQQEPAEAVVENGSPAPAETADEAVAEPPKEADEAPAPEPRPAPAPVAQQAAPAAAEAEQMPAEEPAAMPAVHSFRFEAVSEAVWLQLFLPGENGEKGELRKEALLESGESFTIHEAVESLWITCGNPVALRISVDDRVIAEPGSLGPAGKVLRDYHLQVSPRGDTD